MIVPTPEFTTTDAQNIASRLYGIEGTVSALGGYYDQNFLVASLAGPKFVLKISRLGASEDVLHLQHATMQLLAESEIGVTVPSLVRDCDGRLSCVVGGRLVRLLAYVEGAAWSSRPTVAPPQLVRLGRLVGSIGSALEGFTHPAMDSSNPWDPQNLPALRPLMSALENPRQHAIVDRTVDRFDRVIGPRLKKLPRSVIHGDINNDNVLVDDNGDVVGLIDFEDVSYSPFVSELGIAVAYAMIGQQDPKTAAGHVVDGCAQVRPLNDSEREVVLDLARARLAISVVFAAHNRQTQPGNPHPAVSEAAAWPLLEWFDDSELS